MLFFFLLALKRGAKPTGFKVKGWGSWMHDMWDEKTAMVVTLAGGWGTGATNLIWRRAPGKTKFEVTQSSHFFQFNLSWTQYFIKKYNWNIAVKGIFHKERAEEGLSTFILTQERRQRVKGMQLWWALWGNSKLNNESWNVFFLWTHLIWSSVNHAVSIKSVHLGDTA